MPNVLSPRDRVSRPDNMDETVLHTHYTKIGFDVVKIMAAEAHSQCVDLQTLS